MCRLCIIVVVIVIVIVIVIVVSPTPPQPPTPIMPKWTHTFAVESTSSDRVRAASVAYLAEQHSNSRNKKTRLTDVYSKKASKQEKYLSIVQASDINSILLTADEIRKEVIVFDGTTSHPPPHISPPPDVSIIIIIVIIVIIVLSPSSIID